VNSSNPGSRTSRSAAAASIQELIRRVGFDDRQAEPLPFRAPPAWSCGHNNQICWGVSWALVSASSHRGRLRIDDGGLPAVLSQTMDSSAGTA
jgi:hypothetical protein